VITLTGFKVEYNGEDYMVVPSQDHSYIIVYKDNVQVQILTPSSILGMFWNGVPKHVTLAVACMLAYREIYLPKEQNDKN